MIDKTYLKLKLIIERLRFAERLLHDIASGRIRRDKALSQMNLGDAWRTEALLERNELSMQPRIDHIIRNARDYRASKPAQHPLWCLVQWERRQDFFFVDMTGGRYAQ